MALFQLETASECKFLMPGDSSTCWLFVNDLSQSWSGASQACTSYGGHLAIEHTEALRTAIHAELVKYGFGLSWWIGLRSIIYDNWMWSDGTTLGK